MKSKGETSPFVRSHSVSVCDVSNPTQGLSDEFDSAVNKAEHGAQHEQDLRVIERCEQQILEQAGSCGV